MKKRRRYRNFRCIKPIRRSNRRNCSVILLRVKLIFIAALLASAIIFFGVRARPIVIENAKERADAVISNAICDGVDEALDNDEFQSSKFINVAYDENGDVKTVSCNTVLMNNLMLCANNAVEKHIGENCSGVLRIRAGSLLGFASTQNVGPQLTYKYNLSTNVNSALKSEFTSCGINQTKHRIILKITVCTAILAKWRPDSFEVVCEFPVSETLIVGNVPAAVRSVDFADDTLYKSK